MIDITTDNRFVPEQSEVLVARETFRRIEELHLDEGESLEVQISGADIALPASLTRLLLKALQDVAEGKSIALMPLETELTPNEAAAYLNVSRPFVMKLIESGEIPSRKVGAHHRMRAVDVMNYQQRNEAGRRKALDQLVTQAQELDMGY